MNVVTGHIGRAHHGPAGHRPGGCQQAPPHLLFPGEAVGRTPELIRDIRLSLENQLLTSHHESN